MGQIEIDQIVAQQEVYAIGKVVQLCQCRSQAAAPRAKEEGMFRIRAHCREGMDTAVLDADFEVKREAMFGEICGCVSALHP